MYGEILTSSLFRAACGFGIGLLLSTAGSAQPVGSIPREELQVLASAFRELQSSLVERPDDRALLNAAIKGMVRGADPEAGEYFTAAEFDVYRTPNQPNSAAIGAQVKFTDHRHILVPLEGGPAAEAGIVFGDQLYAVDGKRVKGQGVSDVGRQLHGEPGTRVELTLFRESTLSVHTVSVERKVFTPRGAYLSRPTADIVQLRVPYFNASTLQQAADALSDAWNAVPFKALILDLRGCPGGIVESTVGIAAMFLPRDAVVVQTTGASAEPNRIYRASPEFYNPRAGSDPLANVPAQARNVPMAVLVDGATMSGGEIVAAALQEHRRASVIGQSTGGRASIQTIRPMQMGAIKFTSAYWTSPHGRKLQGVGVTPDRVVGNPEQPEAEQAAMEMLRASMR